MKSPSVCSRSLDLRMQQKTLTTQQLKQKMICLQRERIVYFYVASFSLCRYASVNRAALTFPFNKMQSEFTGTHTDEIGRGKTTHVFQFI